MQKIQFPEMGVPVRTQLTSYYINDTVRQYMEAAESTLREKKLFGLVTGLEKDDSEGAADRLMGMTDFGMRNSLVNMARNSVSFQYWKVAREIYDVHPRMTDALMGMGSKVEIPGSVFRRLRHPDPFFAISGGPEIRHVDGAAGRVIGFYVNGGISDGHPMTDGESPDFRALGLPGLALRKDNGRAVLVRSTHESTNNALHVMVISEVLSSDRSRVDDFDLCRLTIPLTASFSLTGLINETSNSGARWAVGAHGMVNDAGAVEGYLRTISRVAVSHLLYACSRTSEIDEGKNDRPPVRPGKGKDSVKPRKPAKVHRVGYRMGAKIEDSVRQAREQREKGVPTGRRIPPHMRGAHPHLYRVGPGHKEIDIKFLDPIPVNMKDDDGTTATMHPMGHGREV